MDRSKGSENFCCFFLLQRGWGRVLNQEAKYDKDFVQLYLTTFLEYELRDLVILYHVFDSQ